MAQAAQGPGGPWSPTAQAFVQHQLSHVTNFWRQGRPAVIRLESLSDGRASLSLTFQLPQPTEIIPPPAPTSTFNHSPTTTPSLPPKRPIVPLFPSHPTQGLSSKQRKSRRRAVLHRASQQAAQQSRKRPRSSSPTLSQQLREDFNLQDESPSSSPRPENLREAYPRHHPPLSLDTASPRRRDALPSPSPSSPLSLDPASPQRDALLSPPALNLTPILLPRVPDNHEQENSFESNLGEKDSLEEEKECKEEDSVKEDSVKEDSVEEESVKEDSLEESKSEEKMSRKVLETHEQEENTMEKSSVIEVEETLKNPTMVVTSREEPVEDNFSRMKERIIAAVQGGSDLRARFTVESKPDWEEYLSFSTGDILTGVKQAVRPNFLRGTLEGREGLVYILDFEPLS